jgi:hypothetical protein
MTPVPYVNQVGNAPNNDCGPACALMLLRWNGKALDASLTDWAKSLKPGPGSKPAKRSIDAGDDGTTPQDLGGMITSLGLTPAFGGAAQYPYIELVQYSRLPPHNRLVTDKDFLHWIVRLDDTTYHDPYHHGANGQSLKTDKAALDAAEVGTHNRVGVIERPSGASPVQPARAPAWLAPTEPLRLRTTPDAAPTNNILGRIDTGFPMLATDAATDAQGREWRRVRVPVPGLLMATDSTKQYALEGWAAGWYLQPSSEPGPLPVSEPQGDALKPTDFLNLRSAPDDGAPNVIAMLPPNRAVSVAEAQTDAKGRGDWRRVSVPVPGLLTDEAQSRPLAISGWAAGWLMAPVNAPAPPPTPGPGTGGGVVVAPNPTRGPLLGVNALHFADLAMDAASKGCRFFMLMNRFGEAHELKQRFPDAIVMVRRYWGTSVPSIDDAIAQLEVRPDSQLVYTLLNEEDPSNFGYGSPEGIRKRAELDVAVAQRIKAIAPNAKFAAATFSHGTPNFPDPAIARAMRDFYAPHYNSGLFGIDMHNYTKGRVGEIDPIWFETRWQKLFTECGFNPAIREIYTGETGIEGGRGGFPEHGYDDAQFRDWCRFHQNIQAEPLLVDGQSFPSPYLGGALFQLGDDTRSIKQAAQDKEVFGKKYRSWLAYARKRGLIASGRRGGWGHYNVRRYLPVLQEFWS